MMMAERLPPILATGFVADTAEQGSIFPSAGGNSADPRVQAVYWRCIVVLFASARIVAPGLRLVLFTNVTPPRIGDVQIVEALKRLSVEIRQVALARRLPPGRTASWGNVLYFLDIMENLASEPPEQDFALVDSDVVLTRPVDDLFAKLKDCDFVGYRVDTPPDEDVNGMNRRQMSEAAGELFPFTPHGPIDHFGGELFACRLGPWRNHAREFSRIFESAEAGAGAAGLVTTEEHMFSIAFAALGARVGDANDLIKRIWTSVRFSNVQPGDENYPLWHLPAEKRYGLADLFHKLASRDFGVGMSADDFRRLASSTCGIPKKSTAKIIRDGVRQVGAKLGLRN